MSDFTATPDFGATKTSAPRVSNIQFGDGYAQRQSSGLNTNPATWDLSFSNRSTDDIDDIEEFLEGKGGTEAFTWTPPRESEEINVICQSWSRSIEHASVDTLRATFLQVFDP